MASEKLKYASKLASTRILVIGGSSGLGFACCEALIENHCTNLVISSSNPARIEAAIRRLKDAYPSLTKDSTVIGQACDLSDDVELESNLKSLLDFATDNGRQKLDHIVHTAGDRLLQSNIADVTIDQVKKAGNVRFFSSLILGKLASEYLKAGPASSITFTTGAVSQRPMPGWVVPGCYATALHGLTRGLALDLKPIRVNLISPGAVNTELWDFMSQTQKDELLKELGSKYPTGCVGKAEDVALSYTYVMTDHNITGSIISTNSGALLV